MGIIQCLCGAATAQGPVMDEDDFIEIAPAPENELCQMARAMIELAEAVDTTENARARSYLLYAMNGFAYMLNPPRGQLHAIEKE